MAEVASPFNPQYPRREEETYLNYSRGAEAPDALRKPLSPTADSTLDNSLKLGLTLLDVKDKMFQERIRREITADVDNYRDPIIGTSTSQGSPNPNVPADLRRQIDRMDSVTNAVRGKRLTEKHYWMQMENIARSTRSRYPGHREYIDNVIADITGGTPANQLAQTVFNEAASVQDSETKRREWVEKGLIGLGRAPQNMAGYTTDELEMRLNKENAVDTDSKRYKLSLETSNAEVSVRENEAGMYASRELSKRLALAEDEMYKQYETQRASLFAGLKEGSPIPPEKYAEVAALGAELKNARRSVAMEVINEYQMRGMSPTVAKQMLEQVDQESDLIVEDIAGGNANLVDYSANRNKIQQSDDDFLYANSDPSGATRARMAIKRAEGDAGLNAYFSRNGDKLQEADQFIHNTFALRVQDPNNTPPPITDRVKENKKNRSIRDVGATTSADINRQAQAVLNPQLPVNMRARSATTLFGPGNENFLLQISKENGDDVATFQMLNSPQMVQAMEDLNASGKTQEYKNWLAWRDKNFYNLYKPEMDSMKGIIVNRSSMDLTIDPTGRLNISQKSFPEQVATEFAVGVGTGNPFRTFLNPTVETAAAWFSGATSSVDRMNAAIDAMRPGWEAEGKDAGQEVNRLFVMSGVDMNAKKDPLVASSLFGALSDALMEPLRGIAKDVGTVNELSGGRMQLGGPTGNRGGSDLSVQDGLPDFAGEGFQNRTAFTNEQREATQALATELRELLSLRSKIEDPETRKMIDDEIISIKHNGVSPMFKMGVNMGIYQSPINSKNTRGTPGGQDPFSDGSQANSPLMNNPADSLTGAQGIQEIVKFLQDKEYVPGERISTNIIDKQIKNEAEAKQVMDEYFRLRDQAITLARIPGGDATQRAIIMNDARMYNSIIGEIIRRFPGADPETYEMIKRIDRGEEKIREENSVDGAMMRLGVPTNTSGSQPDASREDFFRNILVEGIKASGLPDAVKGDYLSAALTLIPGGAAAKGASTLEKGALRVIEGGLAKQGSFSHISELRKLAEESGVDFRDLNRTFNESGGDMAAVIKEANVGKIAKGVEIDFSRGMAKHAKEAAEISKKIEKLEVKYGKEVTNQFDYRYLEALPKPHSNPAKWSKEESTAVANILGRISYLSSRGEDLAPKEVLEKLNKFARQWRITSVK